MQFAGHYLLKHALYTSFIKKNPNEDLFLIIVIPCFNEPNLLKTLNSIWECDRTNCSVEVFVIINSPDNSPTYIIEQNKKTKLDFSYWQKVHNENKIKFYSIVINNLPIKDAGVGLARKIGMDEAVRRFDYLGRNDGVIIGFDADCTCEKNYLIELEKTFKENKNINACSIQFEHPLQGVEYDGFTYNAIASYELYLRYYISALKFAKHPFAYQTIGSSFAVRAEIYCSQGGMNKRKAGEDFYFLQKIIQLGNYAELNSTKVFPSPRCSDRVPFGTGAAIQKMHDLNNSEYLTYNLKAFNDIEQIVKFANTIYNLNEHEMFFLFLKLSKSLQQFLSENNFEEKIKEIVENSNSRETFLQRFFKWFNMFKVLKYMNYSHPTFYPFVNIVDSAKQFLLIKGINCNTDNSKELCEIYRKNNL